MASTATLPKIIEFLNADAEPSLARVRQLRRVCEQNSYIRKELNELHKSGFGNKDERSAILAYALDYAGDAEEYLNSSKSGLAQTLLGMVYASVDDREGAIKQLGAASNKYPEAQNELVRVLLDDQQLEEAEKHLESVAPGVDNDFLHGRLHEEKGEVEAAINAYESVLEQDQEQLEAAFKLGVLLDRIGDDDMAIEYYLVCADVYPHYVPGVINLGILYDERGEANAAIDCFRQALAHNPNNRRAQMLLRDSRASRSMYYDEKEERERERMEKILKTSVNDFELSVRSRNCLAKMNIFTLGDLISITEQEMLNYKNFGETSLKEVREMLDARGLRLGMLRENEERSYAKADQKTQAESVEKLELSSRTLQVLDYLSVTKIGELLRYDDLQLYRATQSGQSVVQEISTALGAYGLGLHQPEVV